MINKKLIKKTWPLWCIIPFVIWIIIAFVTNENPFPTPQTGSGAMVFYDGEWIGGDIVGDVIVLKNGTEMNFNEFKRITGFKIE